MDVYQKYYGSQPGVVKVIIVGGLAYALYRVYAGQKKREKELEMNQTADYAATELEQLQQQGILPTYSDAQYEQMAIALQGYMSGCGTDEDGVYSIFQYMRNEADVRKLIVIFGLRSYEPCKWSDPNAWAFWLLDNDRYKGSLASWLRYDLAEDEIAHINGILSGAGIQYIF